MMEYARSWMSRAATSTGGRRTLPACGTASWLKSGLPPGRTGGSGTWSDSGFGSVMICSTFQSRR